MALARNGATKRKILFTALMSNTLEVVSLMAAPGTQQKGLCVSMTTKRLVRSRTKGPGLGIEATRMTMVE